MVMGEIDVSELNPVFYLHVDILNCLSFLNYIRPPSNISIHDAMCNEYCLASDALRVQAMKASQCDCLELSTQNTSLTFTREGDFCRSNSAAMLCFDSTHNMCSFAVGCEIDDFSCPRTKYNMAEDISRGFGNECTSSANEQSLLFPLAYLAMTIVLYAK